LVDLGSFPGRVAKAVFEQLKSLLPTLPWRRICAAIPDGTRILLTHPLTIVLTAPVVSLTHILGTPHLRYLGHMDAVIALTAASPFTH